MRRGGDHEPHPGLRAGRARLNVDSPHSGRPRIRFDPSGGRDRAVRGRRRVRRHRGPDPAGGSRHRRRALRPRRGQRRPRARRPGRSAAGPEVRGGADPARRREPERLPRVHDRPPRHRHRPLRDRDRRRQPLHGVRARRARLRRREPDGLREFGVSLGPRRRRGRRRPRRLRRREAVLPRRPLRLRGRDDAREQGRPPVHLDVERSRHEGLQDQRGGPLPEGLLRRAGRLAPEGVPDPPQEPARPRGHPGRSRGARRVRSGCRRSPGLHHELEGRVPPDTLRAERELPSPGSGGRRRGRFRGPFGSPVAGPPTRPRPRPYAAWSARRSASPGAASAAPRSARAPS